MTEKKEKGGDIGTDGGKAEPGTVERYVEIAKEKGFTADDFDNDLDSCLRHLGQTSVDTKHFLDFRVSSERGMTTVLYGKSDHGNRKFVKCFTKAAAAEGKPYGKINHPALFCSASVDIMHKSDYDLYVILKEVCVLELVACAPLPVNLPAFLCREDVRFVPQRSHEHDFDDVHIEKLRHTTVITTSNAAAIRDTLHHRIYGIIHLSDLDEEGANARLQRKYATDMEFVRERD